MSQNPTVLARWFSYKELAIRLPYLCHDSGIHVVRLQWFEYFKVVFLKILNMELCRVFANHVTFYKFVHSIIKTSIVQYHNQ